MMIARDVHTLYLNSGGGTIYGGYALRNLLLERSDIKVIVGSGMRCISNCVLSLTPNNEVVIDDTAEVAVHYVFSKVSKPSNIDVEIDKNLSKEYFYTLTNGDPLLYVEYMDYLVANQIYTNHEVRSQENILIPHNMSGKYLVDDLMYLTSTDLQRYKVIK